MASACIFNPKKFYEVLSWTQNIDDGLGTFRRSYECNDIHFMFPAVNVLHEILVSSNEPPLTKCNALYSVHQILLTSSYLSLFLVEQYILPLLPPIAQHFLQKRSQEELQGYFVERGFSSSYGIKLLGKRYVQLAAEIIIIAAHIKPTENILCNQIQIPSKYHQAYELLLPNVRQLEVKLSTNLVQLRQTYKKKLKTFDPSDLASYLSNLLKEEVVFKESFSPAFKKLLESEDFYISIPLINCCVSELSDLSKDFGHKKQYLALFCGYIKKANIYAIIAAHNSAFIRQIFEQVITVQGDLSLSYGKMIFPEIEGSHEQKQEFYCEFLKCLLIWGICLRKNQVGEVSQLKTMYDYLSKDRGFQFPEILMLQNIIEDYAENIQERQVQNDEMLRIMQEQQHLLSSLENIKVEDVTLIRQPRRHDHYDLRPSNQLYLHSKARGQAVMKSGREGNRSFNQLLKEVQTNMESILKGRSHLQPGIKHLQQFRIEWPQLREVYQPELSSSIIRKGNELQYKIQTIRQLYQRLLNNKVSWRAFKQKVALIVHPHKDSQSYIQKIKQLPFPKKTVNEVSLVSRDEKEGKVMEVAELDFYSKIQLKSQTSEANTHCKRGSAEIKPLFMVGNSLNLKRQLFRRQEEDRIQEAGICRKSNLLQVQEQIIQRAIDPHGDLRAQMKVSIDQGAPSKANMQSPESIGPIEPVTHNDYGIPNLLKKRKQYLQQSRSSYSRKLKSQQIRQIESKILPSDLLQSEQLGQKMTHSDEITPNKSQHSILRKHSSLRSIGLDRSFRMSRISRKLASSSSKESAAQVGALLVDDSKTDQINQTYQLPSQERDPKPRVPGKINGSKEGQQRTRQFGPKACNFDKMIYSITSRSIQAYKDYVNRCQSKPKSTNKLSSTDGSKSNRSIIRKQFERLRPNSRNERTYYLNQSENKPASRQATNLNSDVVSYNAQQSNTLSNYAEQLVTKQFQAYFPVKQGRLIKNCLHSKGLLIDNQMIEVGYVHYQKNHQLDLTLFLTAKVNLKCVRLKLDRDNRLRTAIDVTQLSQLIKGKQEIVKIETSLKGIPYNLPILTLSLQNYTQKKDNYSVVLPCTVNKYAIFRPVSEGDSTLNKYKDTERYRSYVFKINKKLERKGNIKKYLPFFSQCVGASQFITEYVHQKQSCLIGVGQEDQHGWYLFGRTVSNPNTLSFLISSFFYLLEE